MPSPLELTYYIDGVTWAFRAMYLFLKILVQRARRRRNLAVVLVLTALVVSILGNALTFFYFEGRARPDLTAWDSIWYSIISITTIGYGDFSATTLGGRIGTIVFITVFGLVSFTSALGLLVDWIVEFRVMERIGMLKLEAKNHLLIIHFPNGDRVRQVVEEFVSDPIHKKTDIVIVAAHPESLPFSHKNVSFVRGSPLEPETYHRAAVGTANKAIILGTGYDDPNSDSAVASVAHVIRHLNPQLSIVAEVLSPKHELLFGDLQNISLVYTLQMGINLLIQETQDPGVNLLTQVMTSNRLDGTLASTRIDQPPVVPLSYANVAKRLLDDDVNLVGVIRGQEVHLKFGDLYPATEDLLVYISSRRLEWSTLRESLA